MTRFRISYGLHWRTDMPAHEIKKWLAHHWRMFLVLWIAATAVVYVLHVQHENERLAVSRFNAMSKLEDIYGLKMSGAPCTVRSDYEAGKGCEEVPELPIMHWGNTR